MKKCLALLALALLPASIPQAQTPPTDAVLQQIQVPVNRPRIAGTGSVFVRYILIDPGNAKPARDGFAALERAAVLVLLIGGDGTLNLGAGPPPQLNTGSPNFLARNRNHFAAEGFVVAVVDAANDFNNLNLAPNGLRGHRLGASHRADLQAVMHDLRVKYPDLPIWAVGTSRGTISAAVMGTPMTSSDLTPPADGLVLTSSLTGPDAISEDLHHVALESIDAPVLIVTHVEDTCPLTKPDDSDALRARFSASARVQVRHVSGGSTPIDDPCDALAPHGFFGIDQKVVEVIARWIRHREP